MPEERSSARRTAARSPVTVPEERNRALRHLVLGVRHDWLRRPYCSDNFNESLEPGFHRISDASSSYKDTLYLVSAMDGRIWVLTPKISAAE